MASTGRLRVGVAQIDCRLADLAHNRQTHLDHIQEARAAGLELLVFPELSLTGYSLGPRVPEVAMARHAPLVQELAAAAGDMTVVFGFVEEGPGALFYNASAIVRAGQVLHVHRKLNLPSYGRLDEGKLFAQGLQVEAIDLQAPWKAGLLICADLWNPALVHLALQQNATAAQATGPHARHAALRRGGLHQLRI
jgi:predicted amidohydrolase